MSEKLSICPEYQERAKKLVYENMENCERLVKCMEVLNLQWSDVSSDTLIPNANEIHNEIINRFEIIEQYILSRPTEALMNYDGSYTLKFGGLVLIWFWNPVTFELYDFELMFDVGYIKFN